MNKRTRYFMFGSTLVVTLGLATGLVAYYNGNLPIGPNREADEMAYLPADAGVVAYANVREIMNSEFRQKLREVLPTGEEKDKFLAETGIDIENDIDQVYAAVANINAGPAAGGVVVVRGRFNAGMIEGLMRSHGAVLEDYKGKRLLRSPEKAPAGPVRDGALETHGVDLIQEPAVAFLETGLVAIGETRAVKAAIDGQASGQNLTKNADMMRLVGDIRGSNSAWAVGKFDAIAKSAQMPDQVKAHLPGLQWFAVTSQINGGVNGSVRAEANDDAGAENLRQVMQGALAMGRMFAGQDKNIAALLNTFQLAGTGKSVTLSFSVSPEMIDVLTGLAGIAKPTAPEAGIDKK